MDKICFLKHILFLTIQSGLYTIHTQKYSIKLGLAYETGKDYIIVHYDFQEDACMTIRVLRYDKYFKEISNNEYYSEDDVGDYIDSLPIFKESLLNNEILVMLNDMVSFIKIKQTKILN